MNKLLASLDFSDIVSALIAGIVLGFLGWIAKFIYICVNRNRKYGPLSALKGGWHSYYYKPEGDQTKLKQDKWRIRRGLIGCNKYKVEVHNGSGDDSGGGFWRKTIRRIKPKYNFRGSIRIDDLDGCFTAVLDDDVNRVYIRFIKPSCWLSRTDCFQIPEDRSFFKSFISFKWLKKRKSRNNSESPAAEKEITILRGLALASDESNRLRSGVNILSRKEIPETEIEEILKTASSAHEDKRLIRLEAV